MEEKDRAQKLEEAYGMALILFLTLLILLVLQYLRPVAFFLIILLMMPVFFYDWLCFTRLQREERGDPWNRKAEKTPRRRKGLPPWLCLLIAGAVIFQLVNFCISVSTLGNGKHQKKTALISTGYRGRGSRSPKRSTTAWKLQIAGSSLGI